LRKVPFQASVRGLSPPRRAFLVTEGCETPGNPGIGRTRSRPASGRYGSSPSRTPTIVATVSRPGPCTPTYAGPTPTPATPMPSRPTQGTRPHPRREGHPLGRTPADPSTLIRGMSSASRSPACHFAHHLPMAFCDTPKTAATSSRLRPATNAAIARSRRASWADGDRCRASPTRSLTHHQRLRTRTDSDQQEGAITIEMLRKENDPLG
jgi:hypothetical protein